MQTCWLDKVTALGGVVTEPNVLSFNDSIAEAETVTHGNFVAPLLQWAAIGIDGADAQQFLNGQLLNDVRAVDANHGQATGWCSPKGRVLMNGFLVPATAGYLLLLPLALHAECMHRLAMYILRAKVKLRDATEECALLGYGGPNLATVLHNITLTPQETYAVGSGTHGMTMRLPGDQPRWLAWSQSDAAEPFEWQLLSNTCTPVGTAAWDLTGIQAGQSAILPATREAFLPQMLNMDHDGSISFNKGCYAGQEVIARLHYRGEVKRRLYRAELPLPPVPPPMTPVCHMADDPNLSVGNVINAAPNAKGGVTLLAVLDTATNDLVASNLCVSGQPLNALEKIEVAIATG